jgi:hypothetical protein
MPRNRHSSAGVKPVKYLVEFCCICDDAEAARYLFDRKGRSRNGCGWYLGSDAAQCRFNQARNQGYSRQQWREIEETMMAKESQKTYGMLVRDASKNSEAFTHIMLAEADNEATGRALIEAEAKKLKFIADTPIYIAMGAGPRHAKHDSNASTPRARRVERDMKDDRQ